MIGFQGLAFRMLIIPVLLLISFRVTPSLSNQNVILVGQYSNLPAYRVAVQGSYAYVTTARRLIILNVTNPSNPVLVGQTGDLSQTDTEMPIRVTGNYAYVGVSGLLVFDISSVASPRQVASLPDYFYDFVINGNYLYTVTMFNSLCIIDITNPLAPVQKGCTSTTYGCNSGVGVWGHFAYVTDSCASYLSVIDVTDPTSPYEIATTWVEAYSFDIVVANAIGYVSDSSGLHILGLANPASPTSLGYLYGYATLSRVNGDYVYSVGRNRSGGTNTNGLWIIAVDDPSNPIEVGAYQTPVSPSDIAFANGLSYIADGASGLLILRFTGEQTFTVSGRVADSSNNPIIGVNVSAGGASTSTDAGGYYTLLKLSPGRYDIVPTKAGYEFHPVYQTVLLNANANLPTFIASQTANRVDPNQSVVQAQPTNIVADGASAATITITLRNASGQPILGKRVHVDSSRGDLNDVVTQLGLPSDSSGLLTAQVRSTITGTSMMRIWVLDDQFYLATSPIITFVAPIDSDPLKAKARRLGQRSTTELSVMWNDTQAIVNETRYFNATVGTLKAKAVYELIHDLAFNIVDASDPIQGKELVARTLSDLDMPTYQSEIACKMSDALIRDINSLPTNERLRKYTQVAMGYGLLTLAARYNNKCLTDWNVTGDLLVDTLTIGDVASAHLTRDPGQWPVKQIYDDANTSILYDLATLETTNLPPVSDQRMDAYLNDLTSRERTLLLYRQRLSNARMTLENVHASNTADPLGGDWFQVFSRALPKWTATYAFDGAGSAAVSSFYLMIDSYLMGKAIDESTQMLSLGDAVMLKTAPESFTKVDNITHAGINGMVSGILAGRAPTPMKGEITAINHFVEGSGFGPFWKPTRAYSDVTIHNSGNQKVQYQLIANYLAQTTRFKYVPWAQLFLDVESPSIELDANQTSTLRVEYLSGSIGYPPIDGTGVQFVLAATDGSRQLVTDIVGGSIWQPSNAKYILMSNMPISDTAMTIDAPIVSVANAANGDVNIRGTLWVNNPFTTSVWVTVTQPISAYMTPVDFGGGQVIGANIVWNTYVAPEASSMFTYTAMIYVTPGSIVSLPAAGLSLVSPGYGILTDSAKPNPIQFPIYRLFVPVLSR